MINGKLNCGFEYEIDESVFEDMEFLDALTEITEDGMNLSRILRMLFGKEQRAKLYAHLKSIGVKPTIEVIGDIVYEIMTSTEESKNC